jgi:hypothetical protein
VAMESMTRYRGARRRRWRRRPARLHPDKGKGGGWSGFGQRCASVVEVALDLLQVWKNKGH